MQSACQQRMTLLRLLLSCAAKNDVSVDWSRDRFNGCLFVGLVSAIRNNPMARRHHISRNLLEKGLHAMKALSRCGIVTGI
jgi:hypothetical protein